MSPLVDKGLSTDRCVCIIYPQGLTVRPIRAYPYVWASVTVSLLQ